MRFSGLVFAAFLASITVAGCTSSFSGGEPVPQMTFSHMEPFLMNVGNVQIVNEYERGQSGDVSHEMPTPPDLALRRYAQNRLKAVSAADTLYFVIEDAYVRRSLVQPEGAFMRWTGVNDSDEYDMNVVLRMYLQDVNGKQSDHSVMTFNRSVTIPHHYSLAEKELEKLKFMELFMQDVDKAVKNTIAKRGWLQPDAGAVEFETL